MSTSTTLLQSADLRPSADLRTGTAPRSGESATDSALHGFSSALEESDRGQASRPPPRPAARSLAQDEARQPFPVSPSRGLLAPEIGGSERRDTTVQDQAATRTQPSAARLAGQRGQGASFSARQGRDTQAHAPGQGPSSQAQANQAKAIQAQTNQSQANQDQANQDQANQDAVNQDLAAAGQASADPATQAGNAAGDPMQTAFAQAAQALASLKSTDQGDPVGPDPKGKQDGTDGPAGGTPSAIDPALLAALVQPPAPAAASAPGKAADSEAGSVGAAMSGMAGTGAAGMAGDKATGAAGETGKGDKPAENPAVGGKATIHPGVPGSFAEMAKSEMAKSGMVKSGKGHAGDDAAADGAADAGAAGADKAAAQPELPAGLAALAAALKGENGGAKEPRHAGAKGDDPALTVDLLAPSADANDSATPILGATGSAPGSAHAPGRSDTPAATGTPVPMAALPIEIGMKAMEGNQSFSIRLHPEELGRVDVKLHISDDGSVKAEIVVDRVDTLALLQRDAKTLERSFEQAGLKTSDNGLQFSLGSNGQQNGQQGGQQQNQGSSRRSPEVASFNALSGQDLASALSAIRKAAGGLDIRI
jgi:flagellar hook-length control protein FliK